MKSKNLDAVAIADGAYACQPGTHAGHTRARRREAYPEGHQEDRDRRAAHRF